MLDGEKARQAWFETTLNNITDESMSIKDQMGALTEYVRNYYVYDYIYRDTLKMLLYVESSFGMVQIQCESFPSGCLSEIFLLIKVCENKY